MAFQWLDMRIGEERDRREREAGIRERLPRGLDELHGTLAECVAAYAGAFGPESAEIQFQQGRIRILVREQQNGKWEQRSRIEITTGTAPPAFRVDRGGEPYVVEAGLLPGDKMFYRDGDEYITLEELTRRILDRAFFPKLTA